MDSRPFACVLGAAVSVYVAGCTSPFDIPDPIAVNAINPPPGARNHRPPSRYRADDVPTEAFPALSADSSPDGYVRYALFHNPRVEQAYQQWLAAADRLPQVRALPDPRLNFGFFVNEVETRVGAQQARIGAQQTFPWPGELQNKEDAASFAAAAAWQRFQSARLAVSERVVVSLHELAYLDSALQITRDNLDLLRTVEEVIRARYRVATGSHPELIRVQLEYAQLEDRLAQLASMRPSYVADLNAALNRDSSAPIRSLPDLPGRVANLSADNLVEIARRSNPQLLALDDLIEQQRMLTEVARKDGLPDLTVGLDYIVTDEALDSSIPESGDDPILLSFGINLPLWREKYDAAVRESLANRLAVSYERADQANRIFSSIHRAWFEHTDADRRVRLYRQTLIPKAEESLRAYLASYRAGSASFLDLLDTERTLLEFAIASERARADRATALARLNTLAGEIVPTTPADQPHDVENNQ